LSIQVDAGTSCSQVACSLDRQLHRFTNSQPASVDKKQAVLWKEGAVYPAK